MISNNIISEFIQKLELDKIDYNKDFSLSKLSQFKIGGNCPLVIYPKNQNEVFLTLEYIKKFDLNYKILGGGTNLLISDFPNNFVVIHLKGEFQEFSKLSENNFYIGSSANTTPTFRKISKIGYKGAEFLTTIPGWIGGAVCQNAGCYGGEFCNIIKKVSYIENFTLYERKIEDLHFEYRNSEFLGSKKLILGIEIRLEKGNLEEIELKLKENLQKRKSSQPKNRKSAGSIFKNPKGQKAWKLIDESNLRGLSKGGALISDEHCNFIVNMGDAKASEVYYLIKLIEEKVYVKTGIKLEREVEIWGDISL